jgi:glutamate dehydrogenase
MYFPSQMRDGSPIAQESITAHPLAREIVTTETVNEMVNRAGISFAFRLEEEMASTLEDGAARPALVSGSESTSQAVTSEGAKQ